MSFSASAWVDEIAPIIGNPARIAVLAYLARCMNHGDGRCFPKVATIAAKTGLSERCVQKCLRWLEWASLLTPERRGGRLSSLYHLHLGRTPNRPEAAPRGERGAPLGVNVVHLEPPVEVNVVHPEPEEEENQKEEPRESTSPQAAPHTPPPPADEISVSKEGNEEVPDGYQPEPETRELIREAGLDWRDDREATYRWERSRPRRTPLPDDWAPNAEDRAYARSKGLDPDDELPRFVNHHRATGKTMADWAAAWRSWCDKGSVFAARGVRFAPRHGPGRRTVADDIAERLFGRAAA
jgi:hypothetical protein